MDFFRHENAPMGQVYGQRISHNSFEQIVTKHEPILMKSLSAVESWFNVLADEDMMQNVFVIYEGKSDDLPLV
eukprot:46530-Eustigmatos_ZCMA.PRE.1